MTFCTYHIKVFGNLSILCSSKWYEDMIQLLVSEYIPNLHMYGECQVIYVTHMLTLFHINLMVDYKHCLHSYNDHNHCIREYDG